MNPHEQSKTTVNVVVNAIYFKGEWSNPFNKDNTVEGEFHRLDGRSVAVPFMRSWSDQRIACHDAGFKVLELPYKVMNQSMPGFSWEQWHSTPRFSMCVFLPDADDGLRGLVEKMTSSPEAESGEFLHGHLPATSVPVGKFLFPRFKISFGGSVVDDLRSLGLVLPFDPFMASFTDMVEDEAILDGEIYVDKIIHKAVIEVNEEGSVAAAADESDDDMGFSLDDEDVPPKPVDFVADHPFLFFIVEETSGAVAFAGHVLDPSTE